MIVTNSTLANLISTNATISNVVTTNFLGNTATIPNIIHTNITTTSLLTTNVNAVNETVSNLVTLVSATVPNLLSTNTITTNLTSSNVVATNATFTSLTAGTLSLVNINITNETATNILATSVTLGNLLNTNLVGTSATITNLIGTNANYTNLTVGTLALSNINITNETATNILATNATIANIVNTNISTSNSTITNILGTSITATNLVVTNSTIGQLTNTNTTSKGLYITGNASSNTIYIDAQNSTTNPAILLFKNTSGTGDFYIYGDGGDVQWLGGGNRCMQLGAWHEIRLQGGRTVTSQISQLNGSNATWNTIIQNNNDSLALNIWANSTQTQDLTRWANSTGSIIYAAVDRYGGFSINSTELATNVSTGALIVGGGVGINGSLYAGNIFSNGTQLGVFGSNFNGFFNTTGGVSIANTSQNAVLTMTTGTLAAGTYLVQPSYQISMSATSKQADVRLYLTNTNGTLLHNTVWTNSATPGDKLTQMDNINVTFGSGIQTFIMTARQAATGYSTTIGNLRMCLYRVA
jgi:hypothetical protein